MEDRQASDAADQAPKGAGEKEVEREHHEMRAEDIVNHDPRPVTPPKEFTDLVERVSRIETTLTDIMNRFGSLDFASQSQVAELSAALQALSGNADLKGAMDIAGEIAAIKTKLRGLVV